MSPATSLHVRLPDRGRTMRRCAVMTLRSVPSGSLAWGGCPALDEIRGALRAVMCDKARNAARGSTLTRHRAESGISYMPSETGKFMCRTGLLFADAVIGHALKKVAAAARGQHSVRPGFRQT